MKVPGNCLGCNRPRRVSVTGSALMKASAMGRAPVGTCDECQQADDDKRREAHRQRGGR